MTFKEAHIDYITRLGINLPKITDLELAKKRLTYSRWKVSENLDKLLFEFETNVKKNDASVFWCPDTKSTLEQLNKQLKNFSKVEFFKHNAVRHLVNTIGFDVPAPSDSPELVVIGAKFIIANTGNFFSVFDDFKDYEKLLKARKVVVVAGIDSVLSLQSELYTARQLYSVFETGDLVYKAEVLGRPGRIRGLNAEISLLLIDLNKNRLLDIPEHRPLFSLLNFDLPPVCPMQQFNYDPSNWKSVDSLNFVFSSFLDGLKEHPENVRANYGMHLLNGYLPYDLDLYDHIVNARALLNSEAKRPSILNIFDQDRSGFAMNPKKFKDKEKFSKYAEQHFFGKH